MSKLPIKARLVQILSENDRMWDYELINSIYAEYKLSGKEWKWTIRFYLSELISAGLFQVTEIRSDDEGIFRNDKVLHQYTLTAQGSSRAKDVDKMGA